MSFNARTVRGEQQVRAATLGQIPGSFDPALAGGYPILRPLRTIVLPKQSSQGSGFLSKMAQVEADRPLILWPLAATSANGVAANVNGPRVQNWIYAIPCDLKDPGDGQWPSATYRPVITSTNSGVLYLPAGGRYWLYYPDTTTITMLVIDANDPVLAQWYLNRPGNHTFSIHAKDLRVACSAEVLFSSLQAVLPGILGGNRDRKALWIQNTHPTARLRIAFGSAANGEYTLIDAGHPENFEGKGLILQPYEIFKASGDDLFLDTVYAAPDVMGTWTYNSGTDEYDVTTPAENIQVAVWESI